jgi:hypothetical protein
LITNKRNNRERRNKMSEHVFYATTNNHNDREVILFRPTLLISKPPTKEKRISVLVRMPLTGQSNMGSPSWIDSAFTYCGTHHDRICPKIEFKGYSFHFSVDNLFGNNVQANNGSMRKFKISEQGDEENPDVVCEFAMRLPFSEALWSWFGAYAGEPVWVKFVPGVPEEAEGSDDDGPEIEDDDDEEDDDLDPDNEMEAGNDPELDTPIELEYDEGPKLLRGKSGPKDLAAFHEKVVESEAKKGPGRPRKVPAGFSKPLNQGNSEF